MSEHGQQHKPEADQGVIDVIDASRARTCEEGDTRSVGQKISEGVQAANRRRWEADAAQSPEAGVGGRTAERRRRTAKKRLRELADREALLTQLMSQRRSKPFDAPVPADTRRRVSDVEDDGAEGSS